MPFRLFKQRAALVFALLLGCGALSTPPARAWEREPATPYERLERVRFLNNASDDGDSFHVSAKNREFIFRLYFVDTPETDERFPERVKEQADYFGISPADAVKLGKIAAEFTRGKLAGKPFTVYTRWRHAKGSSRLPRYYAFIVVEDKTLQELLVANGLARIYGVPVDTPAGRRASAFKAHLQALEAKAKSDRLGGWALRAAKSGGPAGASSSSWDKMFPNRAAASPTPSATP